MLDDKPAANEWKDGFLFIANMLILNFLNTKPVLEEEPTELLPDVQALERWLIAAGVITSAKGRALLQSRRHSVEARIFLKELIGFRERLREAVTRIEGGSAPRDAFLAEVNSRLLRYPLHRLLRKSDGRIIRAMVFEPHKPADLWAPIMDATADLLSETEAARIRKCESCVLHFFDTSKKGSRRWCSMNICGNKLKVAAYQQRKRARDASITYDYKKARL